MTDTTVKFSSHKVVFPRPYIIKPPSVSLTYKNSQGTTVSSLVQPTKITLKSFQIPAVTKTFSDEADIPTTFSWTANGYCTPLKTLTIVPDPSDATVVLTAPGYTQSGNTISVPAGTAVSYVVSATDCTTQSGSVTVNDNSSLNVVLEKMCKLIYSSEASHVNGSITLTINNTTYNLLTVTKNTEYFYRSIGTFPENTEVTATVTDVGTGRRCWIYINSTSAEDGGVIELVDKTSGSPRYGSYTFTLTERTFIHFYSASTWSHITTAPTESDWDNPS